MGVNMFLSSSLDEHMGPNPSPKAICPLETIQSNLVQVLFLHYRALSYAEHISDLHSSATCARGFCTTEVKPLLPVANFSVNVVLFKIK